MSAPLLIVAGEVLLLVKPDGAAYLWRPVSGWRRLTERSIGGALLKGAEAEEAISRAEGWPVECPGCGGVYGDAGCCIDCEEALDAVARLEDAREAALERAADEEMERSRGI